MQRRRRREEDIQEALSWLLETKKAYHKVITDSKCEKWKELMRSVDDNPWGDAYKIETKKLGRRLLMLSAEQLIKCVEVYF